MAVNIPRTPVREQEPSVRRKNFDEVSYGYNEQEAVLEATRCLQCKKPACVAACPVSVDIPRFIKEVAGGKFEKAAEVISLDSSLPAVCGRVCPQETQCEGSCVRGVKSEPVAIGRLERFVADWSREHFVTFAGKAPENHIKVAIIGSGPSGLACAADLTKAGYDVTIFEALHKAGGVLQYGIPEFRLPKESVVAREIDNLKSMGVRIETNVLFGKTVTMEELMERENFKAIFIGRGAGLPKFMNIPGENLNGVFSANEFLTRNNLMQAYREDADTPVYAGHKTIVVGGGNVAMDAARSAQRLGAEVNIVYRRTENELPARHEEVEHAKEEGVGFLFLTNPVEILSDGRGAVRGVRCEKMELGAPDGSGRRAPVAIKGSEFDIEADVVIMALGTVPNPIHDANGLEYDKRGRIKADENGVTNLAGVFAGGDVVTGAATVILAMGAGRKAAAAIDKYIKSLK